MRKILAVLLLIALCTMPALGASDELAVSLEFAAGTLCAYAAGAVGAMVLSPVFAAGAQGWESLSRRILGAVVGFGVGSVIGSSFGVIGVATLFESDGEVWSCVLGATAGTGLVLGVSVAFEATDRIFPFAPPIAALGAVIGFNTGSGSGTQ